MKYQQIVKIDIDDLCELIRDSIKLNNLYAIGVDNWSGYDDMEYPTDDDVDEWLENLVVE